MSAAQVTVPEGMIVTAQGLWIDPYNIKPGQIEPYDIAHGLAHICRYGGHTADFYSVAQHSVLCSRYATSNENKIWALLHDASEAYIGDIVAPLKNRPEFDFYKEVEAIIMDAVCDRFALHRDPPAELKEIDMRMRATEIRDLIPYPYSTGDDHEPYSEKIYAMPIRSARSQMYYEMGRLGILDE